MAALAIQPALFDAAEGRSMSLLDVDGNESSRSHGAAYLLPSCTARSMGTICPKNRHQWHLTLWSLVCLLDNKLSSRGTGSDLPASCQPQRSCAS